MFIKRWFICRSGGVGSEKIRKRSSDVSLFVTYFYPLKQNGVDFGKWLPGCFPLRHTPLEKARRRRSKPRVGKVFTSWQPEYSIINRATQVALRKKYQKINVIVAIHHRRNADPLKTLVNKKERRRDVDRSRLSPDLNFSWLRVKVCPGSIVRS